MAEKELSEKKTIKEGHNNLESNNKEYGSDKPQFEVSEASPKKIATESKKSRITQEEWRSKTDMMKKGEAGSKSSVKRSLRSNAKK